MLVLSLACLEIKAQTPYIAGSVTLAYMGGFQSDTHFYGGYEFNDKWALGGCVGLNLLAVESNAVAGGFLGAYLRYTPWHNDILYTDIKWRTTGPISVSAAPCGSGSTTISTSSPISSRWASATPTTTPTRWSASSAPAVPWDCTIGSKNQRITTKKHRVSSDAFFVVFIGRK